MFLIQLAAGLALITFGVRFLRKGLDRLLGGRLLVLLERASRNRVQAMGAGVVTGAAAPSSTGLSLLIAQILGSGKMGTDRLLAILLGANVGMTVLANIAALELGDYAGILLFLGVVGFQFIKRERIRGIGQCLLALGFIFLAMNFLKEGAGTFGHSRDVNAVFAILDHHPYLLGIAAAISAMALQSSTATIGLGIGLAAGGVLSVSLFTFWIVGTNIGLGLTSLLVAAGTLEGRRLGAANLLAKLGVAALVLTVHPRGLLALPFAALPLGQQLALMHTAFNVLVALLALPLLKALLLLVKTALVPGPPSTQFAKGRGSFLDPQALESASIALAHATRETLRMTDEVRNMLQTLWGAYLQREPARIKETRAEDDTIDDMHRELILFLSQIGDMGDFDRKWHSVLMGYSSELETVGDILEKNLSATMLRQVVEGLALSAEDNESLGKLFQRTMLQFDLVCGVITNRDPEMAQKIASSREEINAWCLDQKKLHYERLKPADKHALATSLCFLDILDGLRRVDDHLSTIAFALKTNNRRTKRARAKVPQTVPARPKSLPSPNPPQGF